MRGPSLPIAQPLPRQMSFSELSAPSCVKLYSCRQSFVAFKEEGQQWASTGIKQGASAQPAALNRKELSKGMFSMLWSQWPRDPLLQRVAGKIAVGQLLAEKAKGELRTMTPGFLKKLDSFQKRLAEEEGTSKISQTVSDLDGDALSA